jgi:hypothetical protein
MVSSTANTFTKLRVVALSFAVAAGLGLAACGGDDDSSSSDSASTSSDASDLRSKFDDLLQQNLTGTQGLSGTVADCVIKELQANVTDEQIQQVINSGSLTPEVTKAAQQAGIKCASQGG